MTRFFQISKSKKGFTIVELLVSIAIFFIMTALLVAKYGAFNNSVFLTNLAYDIALTLRTAQTYGVSVQGQWNGGVPNYNYSYGVVFCTMDTTCAGVDNFHNKQIVLFADASDDRGSYEAGYDITIATYALKRNAKILSICDTSHVIPGDPNSLPDCNIKRADISFIRPNPEAIICPSHDVGGNSSPCRKVGGVPASSMNITVQAQDQSTRTIRVTRAGQISVEPN